MDGRHVAAPTTEHDAGGLPDHVPLKLDWILVRGLVARRPAVTPAGGLSDHHAVSVGYATPMSVRVRPAFPADAAGILAVVEDGSPTAGRGRK